MKYAILSTGAVLVFCIGVIGYIGMKQSQQGLLYKKESYQQESSVDFTRSDRGRQGEEGIELEEVIAAQKTLTNIEQFTRDIRTIPVEDDLESIEERLYE